MDYREWEQKIKQKLEATSPEEAGYSVNAKEIWKEIAERNKRPKRALFLFRPIVSHVAAMFLGILMSTLIYFLVFLNPKSKKTIAVVENIQQKLPMPHETHGPTTAHNQQTAEKTRSSALKMPKPKHSRNIAAGKAHQFSQKISPKAVKQEMTKDTVLEYANASHDSEQQQTMVPATLSVMHWSDIENHYKNKSEPKYWAKLVRRIDKRLEKDEQSQNNKAPALVWIETFK